jgi:hypothetical protein
MIIDKLARPAGCYRRVEAKAWVKTTLDSAVTESTTDRATAEAWVAAGFYVVETKGFVLVPVKPPWRGLPV